MKIAFVLPGLSGGGIRSVGRIATGLAQRGHELLLLHRTPTRNWRDLARTAYLKLRYSCRHNWLRLFPGRVRPFSLLDADIAGENDVIVGVGVDCVLAVQPLPDRCGIKVHNCRGIESWIEERMLLAWRLRMPRVVVGTHLVAAMRKTGCEDAIFVAHNGVDCAEYYPALPETQRMGVGTVFHGAEVKDPDTILAVLHRVHSLRPATPLYVFGSHPQPRGLPREAQYVRLPSLKVARELYSRSVVWFCASRHEGLPNPLLEATACGCAVVSTACGGASDIVQDGVTGFLVDVADVDALAGRILLLLENRALRRHLRVASQDVLARFTWPRAVDAFEAALLSLVPAARESTLVRHGIVS